MVDKYVSQLPSTILPILDDDFILTSRDGITLNQTIAKSQKDYIRQFYLQLAQVTNNSNTVLTSLSDLQFAVELGKSYQFDYFVRYQTAATTTGIVSTLALTGGATGTLTAMAHAVVAADGTAGGFQGAITTGGDLVTTTTVAAANTDTVLRISGVFNCTASGFVTPQFRSSVNASNVVLQAGSSGVIISS